VAGAARGHMMSLAGLGHTPRVGCVRRLPSAVRTSNGLTSTAPLGTLAFTECGVAQDRNSKIPNQPARPSTTASALREMPWGKGEHPRANGARLEKRQLATRPLVTEATPAMAGDRAPAAFIGVTGAGAGIDLDRPGDEHGTRAAVTPALLEYWWDARCPHRFQGSPCLRHSTC